MQFIVEVPDDKAAFFLELLSYLDFVTVILPDPAEESNPTAPDSIQSL